ncbi:hypothetical protein LOC71_23470 [Rhodopirellula sp. JC740]|uniref:Uncharacterized protein n=1 Tax=Rhodopirellula halodulae TaxID=2894198 RepID=A0ABS8NPE5_9BACT|nr:hypothetical protein [Rhodopirellula sp. JC740]MCC9645249.1 hypothetical protein [Rhodopirellula sp. JC740]
MRKRIPLAVGGGIALLIASQFLDFGLGFQSGDAPSVSTDPNSSSAILDAIVESESDAEEDTNEPMTDLDSMVVPDVADVLIDGERYLVITNANEPEKRQPLTIDEVLALVMSSPGDNSGIQIRISRTPDAIAMTEEFLLQQLNNLGLDEDEIDRRRQLVELPADANETSPTADAP